MTNHAATTAPQIYAFTPEEQARLIAYQQAVRAELYSEIPREDGQPAYHFTPVELVRLSQYRAAVQAGLYCDGR